MSKGNGKKKDPRPTARENAVARAIGQAVGQQLSSQFAGVTAVLGEIKTELVGIKTELTDHGRILNEHGTKLDQLVSGSIGVGRFLALEERVSALERAR